MLSKVLNKNTIKNSYGCLRNMKSIMSSHNKQIPLIIQLIYQADSTKNLDDDYNYYLGLAETTFE